MLAINGKSLKCLMKDNDIIERMNKAKTYSEAYDILFEEAKKRGIKAVRFNKDTKKIEVTK